jgi:predicted O-methyltransferase YrrM
VSKIRSVFRYFNYLFRAKTKHDVHSPFVFDLLTKVIQNRERYTIYEHFEKLRFELLNDYQSIKVTDLGAGSTTLKINDRRITDIARHSLKSPKYSQLLFRLVNHFQSQTILELGTSLGVTTLYLAAANTQANVVTIEGSEAIAELARQNFIKSDAFNIQLVVGNFDEVLQTELKKIKQLDFVFFDGNHRKAPTLSYFEQCLQYAHNNSVFIFDDIHWSDEMEQAWEQIKQHPQVTITIDLFFIGIVFFRKEQVKEHFVLMF